ncbi:hypothetical protein SL103_18730 [Streptomyces lydicus]|uniref:Uncharacterized protein n=1 Tax=Streptomyces lydicus TaxID=47763 RepID=A0A1D7VMM2_9ACTN|nr:hypothetical protein SL103_18730 [Streptomyces lydicus]
MALPAAMTLPYSWADVTTLVAAELVALGVVEAARKCGTSVTLQPVVAPRTWSGPTFQDAGELAAVALARAEQGRPLGELPEA